MLGIAVVKHIKSVWGRSYAVRALLDSCSPVSIVTINRLTQLDLRKCKCSTDIVGVAQNSVASVRGVTSCQLQSHFNSEYTIPSIDR